MPRSSIPAARVRGVDEPRSRTPPPFRSAFQKPFSASARSVRSVVASSVLCHRRTRGESCGARRICGNARSVQNLGWDHDHLQASIHRAAGKVTPSTGLLRQVLVVDDEENLRHMLVVLLKREGYEATAVGSGEQALAEL